jgi:para-nitrobenzyl esterase
MTRFRVLRPVLIAALLTSTLAGEQVRTATGTVEGKTSSDGKIQVFLGIPYAAPPVGQLRWKEPQPASSWEGVRKATDFGARCMQGNVFGDMVFPDHGPSEDCLFLNVWTPDLAPKSKLPVMVWIYGGGFQAGSSSEPRQNGEFLAHKGVVVVSMNYRLGIFGFFSHPELTKESPHHASGNYGLLDQAAALQWVKKNIGAFGGDPDNITIFGESAGSFSVCAQMASPLSRNLITHAIGESGAFFGRTLRAKSLADSESEGIKFAQQIDANSLAKLRDIPSQTMLDSALKGDAFRFNANIDGYFFPASPVEIYGKGEQAQIPLLAGWNRDEGSYEQFFGKDAPTKQGFVSKVTKDYGEDAAADILRVFPAVTEDQMKRSAGELSTADFIAYGTWKWMEVQQASGKPVYRYRFDQPPPLDPAYPDRKTVQVAYHSAEIEYVFGTLDWKKLPWTDADRKVSELMQIYWTNFAKTGDPNSKALPKWPQYNQKTDFSVMHFAPTSQAKPDEQREQYLAIDKASHSVTAKPAD